MSGFGVASGEPAQAHDGVAVHPSEALGLPHAAAVAEVGQDGVGLGLVEAAVEQRGALRSEKRALQVLQ